MLPRLFVLFLCAIGSVGALAESRSAGRLCIGSGECREVCCGSAIEAAPEQRLFTWTSEDGDAIYLGALKAGDAALSCDGYIALDLRVASPKVPRGTTARLRVTHANDAWDVALSARQFEKLRLYLTSATYEIAIAAPRFRRYRKTVLVDKKPLSIVVELQRLPTLTGRVVDDMTGRPVAGALIRSDVESESIADGTGTFLLEADPEEWPKTITASAGGYSEVSLAVAAPRVSTVLDEIRLQRGGSVVVTVEQEHPGDVVAVELQKVRENGRSLGATVQTIEVTATEASRVIRFANVEPDRYIVLAKGDREWERLGDRVDVRPTEESQLVLRIEPFRLRVRASANAEPLADATVLLKNRDALWQSPFKTDSAGEADVQLWQGGRMQLTLESGRGLTMPYREYRNLTDGTDDIWNIDVPPYEINGVVLDDATGKPVVGAAVALRMQSTAGYTFGVDTTADEDGMFRFAPVAPGQHTVSAAARGYPPKDVAYVFAEGEQTKVVTLRLTAAAVVPVNVVDSRGNPIHAARVLDFAGNQRRGIGFTDAQGAVGVQVPAGETRDVYVLPVDGSIGLSQIRAGSPKETVRVNDGSCRIVLRMESDEHVPIPNVWVAIRYNGRMLPDEVTFALMSRGARLKSDSSGRVVLDHMPAGLYEFWPVGSPAELRTVASGGGTGEAPVEIVATPGENVAVMTFVRAEQ